MSGGVYWWNTKTGVTTWEEPRGWAESMGGVNNGGLEGGWMLLTDATTDNPFYWHRETNKTSWDPPSDAGSGAGRQLKQSSAVPVGEEQDWVEVVDPTTGQVYVWNEREKLVAWDVWESLEAVKDWSSALGGGIGGDGGRSAAERLADWQSVIDEVSGATYYYNVRTQQTSWEPPHSGVGVSAANISGLSVKDRLAADRVLRGAHNKTGWGAKVARVLRGAKKKRFPDDPQAAIERVIRGSHAKTKNNTRNVPESSKHAIEMVLRGNRSPRGAAEAARAAGGAKIGKAGRTKSMAMRIAHVLGGGKHGKKGKTEIIQETEMSEKTETEEVDGKKDKDHHHHHTHDKEKDTDGDGHHSRSRKGSSHRRSIHRQGSSRRRHRRSVESKGDSKSTKGGVDKDSSNAITVGAEGGATSKEGAFESASPSRPDISDSVSMSGSDSDDSSGSDYSSGSGSGSSGESYSMSSEDYSGGSYSGMSSDDEGGDAAKLSTVVESTSASGGVLDGAGDSSFCSNSGTGKSTRIRNRQMTNPFTGEHYRAESQDETKLGPDRGPHAPPQVRSEKKRTHRGVDCPCGARVRCGVQCGGLV
jgi:hypothetical protein